jgi:4-amino-4-deoxychorismate lyase
VAAQTDAGFMLADPGQPQLSVLDLGVTRGDGVFETVMVAAGRAPAIDAHLARFASSAHLLDLPEPDIAVWRGAIAAAVAAHPPTPVLAVKLVLTRGVEGTGRPTGWVLAQAARDFSAARENGIRVVTLDRGYRHDVATTSPWLLQGAKTLSYALNAAALREAARRGADDVIFISSDGFVLEAPTASVLLREGNRFCTPPSDLGILAGTTQRRAFEFLRVYGYETDAVRLRASELTRADAIWLVSSIRQAVPVTELDGAPVAVDTELTAQLNDHLSAPA